MHGLVYAMEMGVSLFYLYLDGLVLLLLVTLIMLTDRAGCYNVREKRHCIYYIYCQFFRNGYLFRARRRVSLLMIFSK